MNEAEGNRLADVEERLRRVETTVSTLALLLASHIGAVVVMDKDEIPEKLRRVEES